MTSTKALAKGDRRGGARPGAGRPRTPDVLRALEAIRCELAALRQQRRDKQESFVPILRRLRAIEEKVGLPESPQAPRLSRARPLDA